MGKSDRVTSRGRRRLCVWPAAAWVAAQGGRAVGQAAYGTPPAVAGTADAPAPAEAISACSPGVRVMA